MKPNSTDKSCLRKIGCCQTIENSPSGATSRGILLQEERDSARRNNEKARELIKSWKQAKNFADKNSVIAHDEKPRRLLEIVTRILSFRKMPVIESSQKKEEPKEKEKPKEKTKPKPKPKTKNQKPKTDNFIAVVFGCKNQF